MSAWKQSHQDGSFEYQNSVFLGWMFKIVTIFLFVLKHFTCTTIWILNTHSKSEYVFYYTMEANFVVLARFLLNFVNII